MGLSGLSYITEKYHLAKEKNLGSFPAVVCTISLSRISLANCFCQCQNLHIPLSPFPSHVLVQRHSPSDSVVCLASVVNTASASFLFLQSIGAFIACQFTAQPIHSVSLYRFINLPASAITMYTILTYIPQRPMTSSFSQSHLFFLLPCLQYAQHACRHSSCCSSLENPAIQYPFVN